MINVETQSMGIHSKNSYNTFWACCLREIGSNGEIGIRSIDTKLTQTIDNRTKTIGYMPIALFLSNNQPEMYCRLRLG